MISKWMNIGVICFDWLTDLSDSPIKSIENAIVILNSRLVSANANLDSAKAVCELLKEDIELLEIREEKVKVKIKKALQQNREDLALSFAAETEHLREQMIEARKAFADAVLNYKKAFTYKEVYVKLKDQKIQQALAALKNIERSRLLKKISATIEPISNDYSIDAYDKVLQSVRNEIAI
jgi:phage shock protein A